MVSPRARAEPVKGTLRVLAVLVGIVLLGVAASGWLVPRPLFDETLAGDPLAGVQIAAASSAVTLARAADDGTTLLVASADAAGVQAIELTGFSDPVAAFTGLGYDGLARQVETAGGDARRVSWNALGVPFLAAHPKHVAAGTNFAAHAEEVGLDDGPFLFPKLSRPTPWNAGVPDRTRLDYEAELCALTLDAVSPDEPTRLGYVLCSDFTDRWTLLRDIDLDAPMGSTGFPDAKGGEGMLSVGPLLVIPKDADAFYRDVELRLYQNGRLRQAASAGRMIWSPAEILEHALAGCSTTYQTRRGNIDLTGCDGIPAGTLVLTGTPDGVLFHPLNVWRKGAYLQRGDEVVTTGTHLGMLRNRIE